jgi:hypothetical protein
MVIVYGHYSKYSLHLRTWQHTYKTAGRHNSEDNMNSSVLIPLDVIEELCGIVGKYVTDCCDK